MRQFIYSASTSWYGKWPKKHEFLPHHILEKDNTFLALHLKIFVSTGF